MALDKRYKICVEVKNMPKVSIVLPSYNGEKYIHESIDSILRQTFLDWELIIVDDCSTDDTPKIADEYAERDTRIQVIHNTMNQKLPESLNIGFRQSKGDYLTWTSDDNIYLSYAMEKMVKYLDTYDSEPMVCAKMLIVDKNMQYLREMDQYDGLRMYIDNKVGAAFMYRRAVLHQVGEYDKELFCIEDYDYWIRVLQRYGSIGYLDTVLYLYRLQPNSLSATKERQIKRMQGYLRLKHLDWALSGIGENKACLMKLYNDLLIDEPISCWFKEKYTQLIPELSGERPLKQDIPVILFGAGKIGQKTYELISKCVVAFADSAPSKIGGTKNGLLILSPEALKNRKENCQIVISVNFQYQLEIMQSLIQLGIFQYTLYSRIILDDAFKSSRKAGIMENNGESFV